MNPLTFKRKVIGRGRGSWYLIPDIIEQDVRRKRQIVYGSQAMNKQLPFILRRRTSDYDIYTRHPRRDANQMQRKLDREIAGGEDEFYHKRALHGGTWKVIHEGFDAKRGTEDDEGIVDYTRKPKRVDAVRMSGVLWESIKSIERGKRRTLRDPKSRYRHEKDRADLGRIEGARILKRLYHTPLRRGRK